MIYNAQNNRIDTCVGGDCSFELTYLSDQCVLILPGKGKNQFPTVNYEIFNRGLSFFALGAGIAAFILCISLGFFVYRLYWQRELHKNRGSYLAAHQAKQELPIDAFALTVDYPPKSSNLEIKIDSI